jgi:hypothetical protein
VYVCVCVRVCVCVCVCVLVCVEGEEVCDDERVSGACGIECV